MSVSRVLRELGAVDLAVYQAVARTPTPTLDRPLRRLSHAADRSLLWVGVAGGLAAVGGHAGRRAAGAGLLAVAVDSAVVNIGVKMSTGRHRPDPDLGGVSASRRVPMPTSTSFPSGHTASAFAFAHAVSQTLPACGAPLRVLASAVGYSRVHTGAHYPGDVVAGGVIGATIGQAVGWGLARGAGRRRQRRAG